MHRQFDVRNASVFREAGREWACCSADVALLATWPVGRNPKPEEGRSCVSTV
jgi:hypothetical protein